MDFNPFRTAGKKPTEANTVEELLRLTDFDALLAILIEKREKIRKMAVWFETPSRFQVLFLNVAPPDGVLAGKVISEIALANYIGNPEQQNNLEGGH